MLKIGRNQVLRIDRGVVKSGLWGVIATQS
jgi:hypothetical protein